MPLNIVLIEPEIHTNTGNIGRLSLATGATLHLVKPFGFEITDARLKRAGLDYWNHISLVIYESVDEFFAKNADKNMAFLSSHGNKNYWDINYKEDLYLIFGKESKGLSDKILEANTDETYKIPLFSDKVRSLNLANSVSVVIYEGLRNLKR